MKRALVTLLAIALASPAPAQLSPTPGTEDPRLQTVTYDVARSVRLVTFPDAPLMVILLAGDPIRRAMLSDGSAFEVTVAGHNDSLSIRPLRTGAAATLSVETSQRRYEFELATGTGLMAAYAVRFVQAGAAGSPASAAATPGIPTGDYRMSGDRALRPVRIFDDGLRTYIEWNAEQSLPAVFGIGSSGAEEAVNGHMRQELFTIDRVYRDLVFRIDKAEARARRSQEPGRP